MKQGNSKSMPILTKEEESAIQVIAEKMSEQINQALTASLIELFSIMKENRTQTAGQQALLHPQSDEFLTATDMAKILKISKGLAYRMIQTNEIPSFSIGRTVRVRREDLDVFIKSHMVR